MGKSEVRQIIENYPTKHKYGFIESEIDDILKQLNIKKEDYNKKSGVNTCMLIDGEVINYHCDVELAINCCLENRDKNIIEWD